MFEYEFLPSHIKWLNSRFEEFSHTELGDFAIDLGSQADTLPGQSWFPEIFPDELRPLYELIKDEPIFAELARELEIEMDLI